jgi:hypothetical protein
MLKKDGYLLIRFLPWRGIGGAHTARRTDHGRAASARAVKAGSTRSEIAWWQIRPALYLIVREIALEHGSVPFAHTR